MSGRTPKNPWLHGPCEQPLDAAAGHPQPVRVYVDELGRLIHVFPPGYAEGAVPDDDEGGLRWL